MYLRVNMGRFFYTGILILLLADVTTGAYSDDVTTVLNAILGGSYDKRAQPIATVSLSISFRIYSLNEINIKEQSFSITGSISLHWMDPRLIFTSVPTSSPVDQIYVTMNDIWSPRLINENSVNDINPITNADTPIVVVKTGSVRWTLLRIFTASCEMDTTKYPMDTQTCSLIITPAGPTIKEMILAADSKTGSDTSLYSANGVWELESTSVREYIQFRGKIKFSNLKLLFTFRRRPTYYVLIMMLPVCLLSFLCCAVFMLPPDSGEKIGYSLTVLLSYAVYLSLIADNIPETSVTVSMLTIYVTAIFICGILIVFGTIFVLICHHQPENSPLTPVVRMLTSCVAKVICWKSCCKQKRNKNEVEDIQMGADFQSKDISSEPEAEQITWQEVALVWDTFFMRFFFTIITSLTVAVIVILSI